MIPISFSLERSIKLLSKKVFFDTILRNNCISSLINYKENIKVDYLWGSLQASPDNHFNWIKRNVKTEQNIGKGIESNRIQKT